MKTNKNVICDKSSRFSEYYDMQHIFDALYAKSKRNENFNNLMKLILKRENILLAYREIKRNSGSKTSGTDNITMDDIAKLSPESVIQKVNDIILSEHGYTPKPVRRVEIPKPNGKMRPLGIPCIWDRLIQQCVKQVLEPICEAKFSDNSYGFRPNRSVENAIAALSTIMNHHKQYYVIEFDIESFFDNVDHNKLMRQLWSLGIHDKKLLWLIRRTLKAPILLPNGKLQYPKKGTPQGGIISPLLANVVLNELDHRVENMWCEHPVTQKYYIGHNKNGSEIKSSGYNAMRRTNLKEVRIIRYADDFRIFCNTKSDAEIIKESLSKWISIRLNLKVSEEKTRIVNVQKKYMEFLGFRFRVIQKGNGVKVRNVVISRMGTKSIQKVVKELKDKIKNIQKPRDNREVYQEIRLYNLAVSGIHNYYQIATHISKDCRKISNQINKVIANRLGSTRKKKSTKSNITKECKRMLSDFEYKKYGKSKQLRFHKETGQPIYPIGYVQFRIPKSKKRNVNKYIPESRSEIHQNLRINTSMLKLLMMSPVYNNTIEFADNRISLFSAQYGKCAVTGIEFGHISEIRCHHKIPKEYGGSDQYTNLILVTQDVHTLIHATDKDIIKKYLDVLKLDKTQLKRLNNLRKLAKVFEI